MDDGRSHKLMSDATRESHYREEVTPEFLEYVRSVQKTVAFIQIGFSYMTTPQEWILRTADDGRQNGGKPSDEVLKRLYQDATPRDCFRIILETAVTRSVDGFHHYIARLLIRVFSERPEMLRTEQIPVREALEYSTREELIAHLAEKKVMDLAHGGLPEIVSYLNRNFKLDFDVLMGYYIQACAFIEVRNLVVHHGGRVTTRFIERTKTQEYRLREIFPITTVYENNVMMQAFESIVPPQQDATFKKGGMFPLSAKFVADQLEILTIVARAIDGRFVDKFNLSIVKGDDAALPPSIGTTS